METWGPKLGVMVEVEERGQAGSYSQRQATGNVRLGLH